MLHMASFPPSELLCSCCLAIELMKYCKYMYMNTSSNLQFHFWPQKVSFLYSLIKWLAIINKDLQHVKLRSVNYLTVKSLKLWSHQEAKVRSLSLPSMALPRIQIPSDNESIKTWSVRRSRLEVQLTYTHEPIYFQVIKSRAGTSWGRSCRHREREKTQNHSQASLTPHRCFCLLDKLNAHYEGDASAKTPRVASAQLQ